MWWWRQGFAFSLSPHHFYMLSCSHISHTFRCFHKLSCVSACLLVKIVSLFPIYTRLTISTKCAIFTFCSVPTSPAVLGLLSFKTKTKNYLGNVTHRVLQCLILSHSDFHLILWRRKKFTKNLKFVFWSIFLLKTVCSCLQPPKKSLKTLGTDFLSTIFK